MATRWTHVTITVSNIERSIGFYTSFCGLSVLRDRRREGGGTVWLGPDTPPGKNPTFLLVIGEGEVTSRLDHLVSNATRGSRLIRLPKEGDS